MAEIYSWDKTLEDKKIWGKTFTTQLVMLFRPLQYSFLWDERPTSPSKKHLNQKELKNDIFATFLQQIADRLYWYTPKDPK